jgi:hypothetical protein
MEKKVKKKFCAYKFLDFIDDRTFYQAIECSKTLKNQVKHLKIGKIIYGKMSRTCIKVA